MVGTEGGGTNGVVVVAEDTKDVVVIPGVEMTGGGTRPVIVETKKHQREGQ